MPTSRSVAVRSAASSTAEPGPDPTLPPAAAGTWAAEHPNHLRTHRGGTDEPERWLEPRPAGPAERLAIRSHARPVVLAVGLWAGALVVFTAVLTGIGLLPLHPLGRGPGG